jgi:hypothetical protein
MVAFLTDEDVRGAIIDGLRRHHPAVDVVRVVDVGLAGMDDDVVLDWASAQGRVVVTQDISTMTDAANERVAAGTAMSGLIVAPDYVPIAKVILDLAFIDNVSSAAEFQNNTLWLPL